MSLEKIIEGIEKEREIIVRVRCNDNEHAELIRGDIVNAVKKRTTIYYVSQVRLKPGMTIKESYESKK